MKTLKYIIYLPIYIDIYFRLSGYHLSLTNINNMVYFLTNKKKKKHSFFVSFCAIESIKVRKIDKIRFIEYLYAHDGASYTSISGMCIILYVLYRQKRCVMEISERFKNESTTEYLFIYR